SSATPISERSRGLGFWRCGNKSSSSIPASRRAASHRRVPILYPTHATMREAARRCAAARLGTTFMATPLMPKATAVWLVENTALTFEQIAEFCGLHALEVQAIADGEVAIQMQGLDPVANGQLTTEEIKRCEADPTARLQLGEQAQPVPLVKHKGPRYTPISKRQDKPDA